MTIVIDIRPLMTGAVSGVEVYIQQLLKYLFEIDHTNNYLLFANAASAQKLKNLPVFTNQNVQTVYTRIPNKLLNLSLSLLRWPKIDRLVSKKSGKKIDLYFQPDLRPSPVSREIKKVTVLHDLSFEHYSRFFSLKTRIWHALLNPCREFNESHHIIAVSEFSRQDIVRAYGIDGSKITVVHEGVEDNFGEKITPQDCEKVRQKYKLPAEFFLFLATLEPRKNLTRLVHAFQQFKKNDQSDIKLIIAGKANDSLFSRPELAHDPNIHFTGFIEEGDKATLFSMAKAFLYPSLFEGFGLPLLEAMKCGTPIITSNVSSMPEVVGDSALLVDPLDEKALSEALHEILKSGTRTALQKKMAERIRQFSWKKCAQETFRVFKQMV